MAVSRLGLPILGTGSADQTAKVAIVGGDNQVYPDYGDDSEDLVCDDPFNRIFLRCGECTLAAVYLNIRSSFLTVITNC